MSPHTIHVVHVLHSLEVGGTEHGVVNLINALGDGFRHTVIAMTSSGPLARRLPPDVALHALGKRPGMDGGAVGRLVRLLWRLGPDIVHSRNWGALDAIVAGRLARVPTVIHGEHGREIADPHGLNRKRNRIRRLVAPLVTRFVTVSHDLQEWLTSTVGLPAAKVVTIHNGVDLARFSHEGREAGRQALAVDDHTVLVGAVGRLDPVKDHAGLLDAFASLDQSAIRIELVLVGDGPCRAALERRSQAADLAGRVHLLGERSDVATLLKGLDVYVLPSIAEGISNTILEAMATGLPVVATRTGGNPELVEDGVTGALVPIRNPAALAAALHAYVTNPRLRRLHGQAGRRRATDEFALERMASRYGDLYLSLAGRKAA